MAKLIDLPTLLASQDWARAEKLLRAAAAKKTAGADVFYNLAKVLEAAGKTAQMRTWLKRAVARRPDYAAAWFELGRSALQDDDLQGAFGAFERAMTLSPMDQDAKRNCGRVALRLGYWEAASRCFDGASDAEAELAHYRIAAETGQSTDQMRRALLDQPEHRAQVLKTLTRVARGSLPLRLN